MSAGYGRELWCTDALQTGRYVRGPQVVAQALYRRFTTPRGVLQGLDRKPLAYGMDLSAELGSTATKQTLAALPGKLRAEALKDDRVRDVAVEASSFVQAGDGTWSGTIAIAVALADATGSFTLTLAVSAVAVALTGVRL